MRTTPPASRKKPSLCEQGLDGMVAGLHPDRGAAACLALDPNACWRCTSDSGDHRLGQGGGRGTHES